MFAYTLYGGAKAVIVKKYKIRIDNSTYYGILYTAGMRFIDYIYL